MIYVFLVVFLIAISVFATYSGMKGAELARRYTDETGARAGDREPWQWGFMWAASLAVGGRKFDKATEGYASANSAWYRRVAKVRLPGDPPTPPPSDRPAD